MAKTLTIVFKGIYFEYFEEKFRLNWHTTTITCSSNEFFFSEVIKKTYWYEDVKHIVPGYENYLNRLDSSVKQSIPQINLLEEWYGK